MKTLAKESVTVPLRLTKQEPFVCTDCGAYNLGSALHVRRQSRRTTLDCKGQVPAASKHHPPPTLHLSWLWRPQGPAAKSTERASRHPLARTLGDVSVEQALGARTPASCIRLRSAATASSIPQVTLEDEYRDLALDVVVTKAFVTQSAWLSYALTRRLSLIGQILQPCWSSLWV